MLSLVNSDNGQRRTENVLTLAHLGDDIVAHRYRSVRGALGEASDRWADLMARRCPLLEDAWVWLVIGRTVLAMDGRQPEFDRLTRLFPDPQACEDGPQTALELAGRSRRPELSCDRPLVPTC